MQHLLVTSYEAKALAVRKITSNKGKRTAEVDHINWDTDAKKIEPITDSEADGNSYGFGKFRSTADAIDALHRWLSRDCSSQWILEGDIKGCFDYITHEWLLYNVQIDRQVLKKWLKSGMVFNKLP